MPFPFFEFKKKGGNDLKLNTKMITRVTFRIYDVEFGRKLDELLGKTKMSQQDFFTLLIEEGYKQVYPRYASIPSVSAKEEGLGRETFESSMKELKDLIVACHTTEQRKLSDIQVNNKDLLAIISCVYKMFLNNLDIDIQEEIEAGKFDSAPSRFKRVRDVK